MAADSMDEKVVYPCEPATENELSYAAYFAAAGNQDECQKLRAITSRISAEEVRWTLVRTLWILGSAYEGCNEALEATELKPGMYINRSGDWLLMVHPEEYEIGTALNLSGKTLKSLEQYHTALLSLDVSSCAVLERLHVQNDSVLLDIQGLTQLKQLTVLYLQGCNSITQLPPLDSLTRLTTLDLSGCSSLAQLPEGIRHLTSLRKLFLHGLTLQELPDWLPEIAESFSLGYGVEGGSNKAAVYLHGTTVDDIPDMSIFDLPFEVVAEWFDERKRAWTQPLNEIKVVFLGDGEAGKSHTIARLMNDGGEPDHASFNDWFHPGIVIHDKEYDLGDRKIRVHYWDFGGQEIMHSMHQIFLTGRTMYVVLLNARAEAQNDRAKYWLHNIKSIAPNAPVLLVLNKIDQNENATVDELDLRGRYEKLTQVVKLSALTYSQEQFNNSFTKVLLKEIQNTGFLDAQWPTSWIKVKERLENMETHYIMGDAYEDICEECQVDMNRKNLLHWFNDLGTSFCCADGDDYTLKDYVIMRPDWITNSLYTILFNKLEGAHNGLIPHSSIYNLLSSSHNNPDIRSALPQARYRFVDVDYVLHIMRKFNLSFTDDHGNEFIPMLCQQNSMVDIQYYKRDAETLEFNMVFDYLPSNLLHRLMVERHDELDMTTVWRTGARFHRKELGLSAMVVIDENTLSFFIRYTHSMYRPNTYLTMLKAHVERIVAQMGLKVPICRLTYKLDGKRDEFDLEELTMLQEVGQTQAFSRSLRRMIPIEDILNQVGPDSLKDEKKLLNAILRSCCNIQEVPSYYLKPVENNRGIEDKWNRRIRDDLEMLGYIVRHRPLRELGGAGVHAGELDLLIYNDRMEPWSTIETMHLQQGKASIRMWDDHFTHMLDASNYRDLSPLFLISFLECGPVEYLDQWRRYSEHIRRFSPGRSELLDGSYEELANDLQYLKTVRCRYFVNGRDVTVYHCFVRIPQIEITDEYISVEDTPTNPSYDPVASHTQYTTEGQGQNNPEAIIETQTAVSQQVLLDYRIVFLGDSEAGKTLILSRLDKPKMDPKDFHDNTTIGINIVRKEETINGQPVRLNYWDFGGQDILHSMHRIFLAKNTLYVIVLNTRNDNQDAQAIFWLRYVEAYAPGSPVLLVMNKTDQNKRAALNLPVLNSLFYPRVFEPENVLKISAVWPEKEKFQTEFTEKLHACIGRYLSTAKSFTPQEIRIRDKVEDRKKTEKLKVISIDDFRDICEEEALDDEKDQYMLMERFNEAGVLVYFRGKTVMFMNPEWITRTIYKILDQDEQIADNGVVLHRKIRSFCRNNEDNINRSEDAAHLLDIMRDYDLSFWYEKQKPGEEHTEDKEFIPMLCQREEPQAIKTLIEQDNTVELRMVFEYLPCGVLYKLMVDHHNELDMDHVWRTGMKLDHENGSYAVVRQEGNAMGIYVHDAYVSRGIEWMIRLKDQVTEAAKHNIFHALLLETKIAYWISGVKEYFDYQQLKNAEESSLYYTVSRSIPPQKVAIRDILAQKDGTVLERIKELLKLTSEGCQELQGRHTFWFLTKEAKDDRIAPKMDEDSRTAELRSVLRSKFTVKDQPRWGDSSGGIKQGELDLWIGIDEHTPLAILEALNISTPENAKSVASWKEHLTRMMCDYNKNGFNNLLLVSYLDCPLEKIVQTRKDYFEIMRDYEMPSYGTPKYCEPIVVDEFSDGIQVVRADYSSGAGDVTVYHFLVRIEQYGKKAIKKAEKKNTEPLE